MSSLSGLLSNKALVLGVAFAVSLGGATAITAVLDGDDTGDEASAASDAVPVLAPIASGHTPPEPVDPASGESGPLSPVVDGSGGGPGAIAAGGDPLAAGGGSGVDVVGADGSDGSSSGGDGADSDSETIFTDECAGPEPGAEPAEDCPEGTGGTVLALTEPWPQWAHFFPDRPAGGWSSRCSDDPVGEGEMQATVVTLNPGTMRLEYWPDRDATSVTTVEDSTADESHAEHELWAGWFEDGTLNSENHKRVQYCLVLRDLRPGTTYWYEVTSTDIFGSTGSTGGSFSTSDPRGRPPVTIMPASTHRRVDASRIDVRVPVRSSENEHAVVRAIPGDGSGASTCSEAETAGDLGTEEERFGLRPTTSALRDLDEDAVGAGGHVSYDQVHRHVLSLDEGTTSRVCIWWVRGARRSFDVDQVSEREEHLVTTPNRYRIRVTVESLTLRRALEAESVRVGFAGSVGSLCFATRMPPAAVDPAPSRTTTLESETVVCDLTDVGDTGAVGDSLDIEVSGLPGGPVQTRRIDISRRPCGDGGCDPTHSDWYRRNIPAERDVQRICGTGASCEYARDESVGTMQLRVDFIDGPDRGGDDYSFGAPTEFEGIDEPPPEPPPHPQLDEFTARVEPIDGRHDALAVFANFDRPVTARAFVQPSGPPDDPDLDDYWCLQPDAGGTTAPAPASTAHSFVLEGLCAGFGYHVALEVTDADGTVWYVGSHWLDLPEPRLLSELLVAWVPSFERTVQAELFFLETPEGGTRGAVDVTRASVSVGAYGPVHWPTSEEICRRVSPGFATHRTLVERLSFSQRPVTITVHVEGSAAGVFEGGGCEPVGPSTSTTIRTTLTVEEFLASPEIVLTSPVDDELRVEVRITCPLLGGRGC